MREPAAAVAGPACGSCPQFISGSPYLQRMQKAGTKVDLSDHLSIITSRRTGQIILNALDPSAAKSLPCDPVLPLLGTNLLAPA